MKFTRNHNPLPEHVPAVKGWMHSVRPEGLTDAERAHARGLLLEYMAMKPARSGQAAQARTSSLLVAFTAHARSFSAAFAAVLIVVSAGSTAYAAEGALPGDALYPLKIHVDEKVEGAFALGDAEKAKWSLTLAQRRLEEASTLALTNGLTPDTRAQVETNLNASLADAETRASRIQESDPLAASDIAISASALLQAHAAVLSAIRASAPGDTRSEVSSLLADVSTRIKVSSAVQSVAIADSVGAKATPLAVNAQKAAAKSRIDSAQQLLAAATGSLDLELAQPVNIWSGAEAQLQAAKAAYSEGSAQEGDAAVASGNFNTALQAASGVAATVSARVHVLDVLEKTGALDASTTIRAAVEDDATSTAIVPGPSDARAEAASGTPSSAVPRAFSAMMRTDATPAAATGTASSTTTDSSDDAATAKHNAPIGVSASSIISALQRF